MLLSILSARLSCQGRTVLRQVTPMLGPAATVSAQQHRSVTNKRSNYQVKMHNKHYLPKWRALRRLKVIKVDLPDFHEDASKLSTEEIRSKMKQRGLQPPVPWREREIELSSSGEVVDPYVPPEGDGRVSLVSSQAPRQAVTQLEKKSKSMMAVRKIRSFDEDFDVGDFANGPAVRIYQEMHKAMMGGDEYELGKYVTEKALGEILINLKHKTLRWKFLESIEPARVVHARCMEMISKENIFAQVTVRFHTKQTLGIYDRFGRLSYGNELTPKDVLEYVVFEKHMSNLYGEWRVHGKIVPEWNKARVVTDSHRTVVL